MVGRDVQLKVEKAEQEPGEVVLDVRHITVPSKMHKKNAVRDVSFQVRQMCIRDRNTYRPRQPASEEWRNKWSD